MTMYYDASEERYLEQKRREREAAPAPSDIVVTVKITRFETEADRLMRLIREASCT